MSELRFDDRVAVITGAGRGLGRAYALLLASRGAKIVVNDLGASLKGEAADAGPAEEVVQEIKAAGGEAIACTDSAPPHSPTQPVTRGAAAGVKDTHPPASSRARLRADQLPAIRAGTGDGPCITHLRC